MNDTTFLVREVKDSFEMKRTLGYGYNFYHAIYFERNKNAKEYDWIKDFGFEELYGKKEYQRDINETKKILKTKLKKVPLKGIITKWCVLNSYKDSFYMYSPSDYCYNYQIEVTDSVVIDKGCERTFDFLDTIIKKSSILYQLKFKPAIGPSNHKKYIRTVNIYIINSKEGIAVFEDNRFNEKHYNLMVNANNVKHFPLIVNYCITDKTGEFEFDKIDFQKLIKQSTERTSVRRN